MPTPTLNWKEIAELIDRIRPEVTGLFVDKVIVPERPRFTEGYLKGEWMIRLRGKRGEAGLLFSIRPRNPYLALVAGKGPRAATRATHSPFSLALGAQLKDARLNSIEALPRERIVVLWFTAPEGKGQELGLVLLLIPAVPEALLVRRGGPGQVPGSGAGASSRMGASQAPSPASESAPTWPISFRSRQAEVPAGELFRIPEGAHPPGEPAVRAELVGDPMALARAISAALDLDSFGLRLRAAEKELKALVKQSRERVRQSETALREAEADPDWQHYGDLLKAHLGNPPRVSAKGTRAVLDYATGDEVELPADPKLGPREQVEKFFQLARRKTRRLEEAKSRADSFRELAERAEGKLSSPPAPGDWTLLEAFERAANILPPTVVARAPGTKKQLGGWAGKTFLSRDGLAILVGRSRDENLELTFKRARGNDLWLHLRGRPGAHVVVLLHPGKSPPLETLLDAAALTVYYSGGESWGKTEVDYTFKKYVKRIKDSTEASYVNNKTLIMEPDPERLKRLLGQQER